MAHINPYEGNQPYIFISYAHLDTARVLPTISALQDRGFRIWYDAGIEAGTEWPEVIAEHLCQCDAFLAFVSDNSLQSQNCRREINFAIELQKKQLVIYLEDVHPSPGMRMQLGTMQAIFRNRHRTQSSFLDELCRSRVLSACLKRDEDDPESDYCKGVISMEENDYDTAAAYFRKAADAGYPDAQYELGRCYATGKGVPADTMEAMKWYRKAADQKYGLAISEIALCYEQGIGVSRDLREAFEWYRKGAELGDANCQLYLGGCYETGVGTSKDTQKAMKWYTKAIANGNHIAEMHLASLLESNKNPLDVASDDDFDDDDFDNDPIAEKLNALSDAELLELFGMLFED